MINTKMFDHTVIMENRCSKVIKLKVCYWGSLGHPLTLFHPSRRCSCHKAPSLATALAASGPDALAIEVDRASLISGKWPDGRSGFPVRKQRVSKF
jgi:hypothetical protein